MYDFALIPVTLLSIQILRNTLICLNQYLLQLQGLGPEEGLQADEWSQAATLLDRIHRATSGSTLAPEPPPCWRIRDKLPSDGLPHTDTEPSRYRVPDCVM